jgi:hypothetical protein
MFHFSDPSNLENLRDALLSGLILATPYLARLCVLSIQVKIKDFERKLDRNTALTQSTLQEMQRNRIFEEKPRHIPVNKEKDKLDK